MPSLLANFSFRNFRGDLFGGLTAAVIALPLALAFGVASGLGPIAGLYGAIATGFFAAVFGGTPAQVSGPTGPMTVVMGAIVASHADNLPEAFAIVILGGLLQIVFGAARLGRYVTYTPYSVVSGFMTGIGTIIIILQTLPFLGLKQAGGGPVGTLRALPGLDLAAINLSAVLLAGMSLLIVTLWPDRLRRLIPPPLAALVIGTLAGMTMLSGAPVIGEVPSGLPMPHVPSFALGNLPDIVQAGLVLALLGSIDSLLTSLVADSITRTRHDSNRELIGQGLGNIVSGLFGGLPGAGATMRTVVNVQAGGRGPLSGALHALVLLALVLGMGPLAERVPHAVLAGILLKVGWDIIDWGYIKRLRRVPVEKAVVMLITLGLTVFVDLIMAVAVGIILAAFVNARALETEQLKGVALHDGNDRADGAELDAAHAAKLREAAGAILLTRLRGAFSYASAREFARRVAQHIPGYRLVIYDFTEVGYVDPSAAVAIDDLFTQAIADGQTVLVAGLSGRVRQTLEGFGVLDDIPAGQRYDSRAEAIDAAVELWRKSAGPSAGASAGGVAAQPS